MKNYFNFLLTGKQLLPLWIIFYLIFIIPYVIVLYKMQTFTAVEVPQKPPFWIFGVFLALLFFVMIWSFYFTKMIFQGISLKEIPIQCNYDFGKYVGKVVLGFFLSIITIGIYSPWFIRNMMRFYTDNASYNGSNFSFRGKGGELFLIITVSVFIPVIIISLLMVKLFGVNFQYQPLYIRVPFQMIIYIVLVPYMYFVYKWTVDFKYKEYRIKWNAELVPSLGKILLEVVLSMITFGIYMPMAFLRLYAYFSERTISNTIDNQRFQFGYDLNQLEDFLYIWGQTLLIIITLGIYYPWALCKLTQRILGKTFLEKINC